MFRFPARFTGSANRRFVITRAASTALALFLALVYTKVLGVDKRSVLAFVMTASLIVTIIFTSGISLTYRKNIHKGENERNLDAYLFLITFLSFMVAIASTGLLVIYSNIQTTIPLNLYLISFIYSFSACLNFGFQDALLANARLKTATTLDLATILFQILTCALMFTLNITSLIVSVFVAFISSYIFVTMITLMNLKESIHFELSSLLPRTILMIKESSHNYLYGIANGLADRVDRLIIGFILPIGYLAKYSLMSSLLMYTRFLPDALSKLSLMSEEARNKLSSQVKGRRVILGITLIACTLSALVQFFIFLVFGSIWLLPIIVPFLFALQEVFRGYYQIGTAKLISQGNERLVAKSSLALIVLSILFISAATYALGIAGAPLSMIFVYSLLNYQVQMSAKGQAV